MNKLVMIVALAGAASSALAQNTGVRLTDGDAVFQIAGTGTATVFQTSATSSFGGRITTDHRVNGGTSGSDLAFDMQWYIGFAGRAREFGLSTNPLSGITRTTTGTNQVSYAMNNAFGITGLTAVASWSLIDNGLGANTSQVIATLTLTNNTAAALTGFDTFFSIDNDIVNAAGDTFDALSIVGPDRVLVQRDTTAVGGPYASALIGFGADASGAGSFSAINTQFTDTGADFVTLADLGFAGNLTAADYAHMVQWRRTLGVGESITLRADVIGGIGAGVVVPTPGAAALLGAGLLASGRRRRA